MLWPHPYAPATQAVYYFIKSKNAAFYPPHLSNGYRARALGKNAGSPMCINGSEGQQAAKQENQLKHW
jgi:hypothetical protein